MVNLDNLFTRITFLGLNAKKVSEATGISTGNISDWKSGRSMPSAIKLNILADYLNCSVDYLLGRTDNPQAYNDSELYEFAHRINQLPDDKKNEIIKILDEK